MKMKQWAISQREYRAGERFSENMEWEGDKNAEGDGPHFKK